MDDTRQELYQRSLRNVRAVLDKEQAEAAREKRGIRLLLLAFAAAVLLATAALLVWIESRRDADAAALKVAMCFGRAWAPSWKERERETRAQNPNLSPAELDVRLRAASAALERALVQECRPAK